MLVMTTHPDTLDDHKTLIGDTIADLSTALTAAFEAATTLQYNTAPMRDPMDYCDGWNVALNAAVGITTHLASAQRLLAHAASAVDPMLNDNTRAF